MNQQPLKTQSYRCRKLETYNPPNKLGFCASSHAVQPTKPSASQPDADKKASPSRSLLIGTKIGECDICKATKKTLLLRYGFTLCKDCLLICTNILEHLELQKTNQTPKAKTLISRQISQPSAKLKEA